VNSWLGVLVQVTLSSPCNSHLFSTFRATQTMNQAENNWKRNGFGDRFAVGDNSGGKFTKEESELVRKTVLEYCAEKGISTDRLCAECQHKADLRGAWMEIAKQLPHRSVQSVYRHGLRILHPFKRGAWTEAEIEKLFDSVTKHGKKWVKVQEDLNRYADACRDKYREFSEDFVKGRWKEHEAEQLKGLIREHLKTDPNATMADIAKMVKAEGLSLPWGIFSQKMVNRSRLSCFKKWQKMSGLWSSICEEGEKVRSEHQGSAAASTTGSTRRRRKVESVEDVVVEGLTEDPMDEEMHLLSELAQSGATRSTEVTWDTLRTEDAQERWNSIILEWQQQEGEEATEEALTTYPFYELAQHLLDRKTSAKMAAETVEAVDLPEV
jgi:Myb-like DNA-binding domain